MLNMERHNVRCRHVWRLQFGSGMEKTGNLRFRRRFPSPRLPAEGEDARPFATDDTTG